MIKQDKGFHFFTFFYIFIPFCICVPNEGNYFKKHHFRKAEGEVLQTCSVQDSFDCCWKCEQLSDCVAVNIKDKSDVKGFHECILLKEESSQSRVLNISTTYHHYTRQVDACSTPRCLNGGTCQTLNEYNFRCQCAPSFGGDLCTKSYKWLKVNTSPVCFGTKNSQFGRFYIKESGTVSTVKLVHISGYVTCINDARYVSSRSNWGCAVYYYYPDRLITIITDNQNRRILPRDINYSTLRLEYTIPGYNSKSPELVFRNFTTPRNMAAAAEFRVWYGQDLANISVDNNEGTACMDVLVYGLFNV